MTKHLLSVDYQLDIGRRIGEILEEKGSAFSVAAFSQRIGISKDKLYRSIQGARFMKPSELEKVALGLGISLDRLKQGDLAGNVEELKQLLMTAKNLRRALELAEGLCSIALGVTERCAAFNNLARVQFLLGKYEPAHVSWVNAYQYAEKIHEKYSISQPLFYVMRNLMVSFTVRKDYLNAERLVEKINPMLNDDPAALAAFSYTLAMIAFEKGYLEEAREKFYQELSYNQKTGEQHRIGRSERNVGLIEYKIGNHMKAKTYFEQALRTLSQFEGDRLIVAKDYVKLLLKMGSNKKAEQLIQHSLDALKFREEHELKAKFLLLHSICRDEIHGAQSVLFLDEVGVEFMCAACKFLMDYCYRTGDAEGMMKYYKIADTLSKESSLFEWEGLM